MGGIFSDNSPTFDFKGTYECYEKPFVKLTSLISHQAKKGGTMDVVQDVWTEERRAGTRQSVTPIHRKKARLSVLWLMIDQRSLWSI